MLVEALTRWIALAAAPEQLLGAAVLVAVVALAVLLARAVLPAARLGTRSLVARRIADGRSRALSRALDQGAPGHRLARAPGARSLPA